MRNKLFRRNRCPHSNLIGVYGDKINMVGGYRLFCNDCKMYLNGPVALAKSRESERGLL